MILRLMLQKFDDAESCCPTRVACAADTTLFAQTTLTEFAFGVLRAWTLFAARFGAVLCCTPLLAEGLRTVACDPR